MSVSALTSAFYHSESKYTTRLVLLAIANFDNPLGSFPSLDTIGRLAGGVNRRTVQRAIDELVELGELTEVSRNGTTNLYRLTISCPENCDGSTSHKPQNKGGGVQTTRGPQTTGGGGVQTTGGAVSRPPKLKDNAKNNSTAFEDFWREYPKKEGKQSSLIAFNKALKLVTAEELIEAAKNYALATKNREKQYIRKAYNWLKDEDYLNQEAPKQQGGGIWDQNPI